MRVLSLLLIGGLVLLIASPTWAVTVPTISYGWNFVHARNEDNGTAYFYTGDPELTPPTTFNPNDPLPDGVGTQPAAGPLFGAEDSWGIFLLYQISEGTPTADMTKVGQTFGGATTYSNSDGSNGTWLVGIFYGQTDTSVTLKTPTAGATSSFSVLASGLNFELWAVDETSLDLFTHDSTNLTAYDATRRTLANRYTGWVEGGGVEVLSGTTSYFEFDGNFYPTGYFDGTATLYFDIPVAGPGVWNQYIGGNGLNGLGALIDPNGNQADAWLTWELNAPQPGLNWSTYSHDDGGFYAVPEPITMAGLMLAIGCVGQYIRKRR